MNAVAPILEPSPTLLARLNALPETLTGEILNGRLETQPRPSGPHGRAELAIGGRLFDPFDGGRGGPGGWHILIEPEVHLSPHVLVPDLAGWRRESMRYLPRDHRFTVVPDWVCEILSPSTARKDRVQKLPIYAAFGVAHCWLVDPLARVLEVFALDGGHWTLLGSHGDAEVVRAAPFDAIEIDLSAWWAELEPDPESRGIE